MLIKLKNSFRLFIELYYSLPLAKLNQSDSPASHSNKTIFILIAFSRTIPPELIKGLEASSWKPEAKDYSCL